MEKSLVDKLKNGTLDSIDEDMVVARIRNVDKQIEKVLEQISTSIHALSDICEEHKEEVVLLGFTFICAFDTDIQKKTRVKRGTYQENDAACAYVIGTPNNVNTMCNAVKQVSSS